MIKLRANQKVNELIEEHWHKIIKTIKKHHIENTFGARSLIALLIYNKIKPEKLFNGYEGELSTDEVKIKRFIGSETENDTLHVKIVKRGRRKELKYTVAGSPDTSWYVVEATGILY